MRTPQPSPALAQIHIALLQLVCQKPELPVSDLTWPERLRQVCNTCIYECVRVCVCVYTYLYMYIYICVCVCVCVCVCDCVIYM